MRPFFRFAASAATAVLLTTTAFAGTTPAADSPAASAEQFVETCASRLDLTETQRESLSAYLDQEMDFLAVQAANHTPAEVAQLLPAEREEFAQVTSRLLSPEQLQQFRKLQATPKMQRYLRRMALEE